jgi:trans-2,3-dihydro-3-hydroxyanthranilate isomerase
MTTGTRTTSSPLALHHVDVFSSDPLSGNALTVVLGEQQLTASTMLRIAQELNQFETIFLTAITVDAADARIFSPEEELGFAGHPVLGAAAVLHKRLHPAAPERSWRLRVGGRPLPVATTTRDGVVVEAEMDQGTAVMSEPLPAALAHRFAAALGLVPEQLRTDLPTQVASTGLPYLLVPVTPEGLAAGHAAAELPSMLREVGAAFVYVLDPDRPEGRTWDQRGLTEDVATGSAAGPTAAYLVQHGRRRADEPFEVHQGQYVGRPSRMRVRVGADGSVRVGGPVVPFSSGLIETPLA